VSREGQEATGTPRVDADEADDQGMALEPTVAEQPVSAVDATRFAHASEAEMARILDFYQVRWDYEPTTFPILWNLDGEVVESFAPDFYLPDLEVFLEMTTLKQRLVRKKNRKLRRLRELYPDIRIKLFYARDFRAMMLKYGRLGLAASLSGTLGQVMPGRAVVNPVAAADAPDPLAADALAPDPGAADAAQPVAPDVPTRLHSGAAAATHPAVIEAVIPVGEVVFDLGATETLAAADDLAADDLAAADDPAAADNLVPPPHPAAPPIDRQPAPAVPRATPRRRSGRRRRRAALSTQAGAEREAGA
jgi:hypoxanthine phosphoribosyltransferase